MSALVKSGLARSLHKRLSSCKVRIVFKTSNRLRKNNDNNNNNDSNNNKNHNGEMAWLDPWGQSKETNMDLRHGMPSTTEHWG